MSYELIRLALKQPMPDGAAVLSARMSVDAWMTDQEMRADKVALFRRYADGEHDANLSDEMRDLLRVSSAGTLDKFNLNHCDRILQAEVNRLEVDRFECGSDTANDWAAGVLEANRFDAMQTDVHEAALRDADTYVMVSWDNDTRQLVLTHEPAYNGQSGMLALFGPDNTIITAVKVWAETRDSIGDTTRINVYYADRIEKYISRDDSTLERYEEEGQPWPLPLLVQGQPMGVPVVHVPNRGTSYDSYGRSEIEDIIPPQNAINRTLHSMVATSELTGFPVRWAKGFAPPSTLTPGMWIAIGKEGLRDDQVVDLGVMEQGEIVPFIQQLEKLIDEMYRISDTPAPEYMASSNASGEALKQREIGLLGKIKRFQVKVGNRWEDVIKLAGRMQTAYGGEVPAFNTVTCHWADAEIRSDNDVIARAQVLIEMGLIQEGLRQMAPVFDWNHEKLDDLYAEYQAGQAGALATLAGNMQVPTFDTFGLNLAA